MNKTIHVRIKVNFLDLQIRFNSLGHNWFH